jgi:hypothetical protein
MLVTSLTEYQRWYGSFIDTAVSFLPFAMKGFFDNGGKRAYIARVVGAGALPSSLPIPGANLTVEAIGPGPWGDRIFVRVRASTLQRNNAPVGFRLTFLYYATSPPLPLVDPFDPANLLDPNRREPDAVEDYDNLRIDPNSQDFALTAVNPFSQLVQLLQTGVVALPGPTGYNPLAGGAEPAPAGFNEYLGSTNVPNDQRRGLAGLDSIDEISLLCVPDEVLIANLREEVVTQCIRRKDRFAILQVDKGIGNITPAAPRPPLDSSYSAFYSPWIRVFNPVTQDYPLIPPGGHIAGIYANTDTERGVHKAPANYEILGMVTRDIDTTRKPLEFTFSKGEHDLLNPRGVNVIRDFRSHGRGIRVFGARTASTDTQWKYVNVRRLFIFVEQSIERGTQWLVFEPNDDATWARIRRSITNFLVTVWRNGALMGLTQDEAFFVKCDRTTMTQDDIDNGRLICYIGIAPVKPAEFVIFRFSQKTIEAAQ